MVISTKFCLSQPKKPREDLSQIPTFQNTLIALSRNTKTLRKKNQQTAKSTMSFH